MALRGVFAGGFVALSAVTFPVSGFSVVRDLQTRQCLVKPETKTEQAKDVAFLCVKGGKVLKHKLKGTLPKGEVFNTNVVCDKCINDDGYFQARERAAARKKLLLKMIQQQDGGEPPKKSSSTAPSASSKKQVSDPEPKNSQPAVSKQPPVATKTALLDTESSTSSKKSPADLALEDQMEKNNAFEKMANDLMRDNDKFLADLNQEEETDHDSSQPHPTSKSGAAFLQKKGSKKG